ncbi:MAG TPA: tetratricopeptide repeat protein [Nitrosopumilus sp.]|nr:tetratricopeptide repeat protein [Thermoproteota archaeon]HJJ22504.1 tetratricopeptide repeat protein [Nitrosopumilus sp.]
MVSLFRYPKRHLKKLIKEGEYVEAIELGKSLESKFSNDHDFMFIMGSAYFIVEDAKKALPYFEKAFQLDNNDIETITLKTNVHLALQQKDEAIICCKQILKLESKNSEAQRLLEELENL